MKNYSSEGIQLAIKTGNKYYSSDLVLEENIAGVAVINSVDEKTTTRFGGIFKISKDSSTFTLGQAVYFNTTTKLATDNPIGAVQIGFCIEDFESVVSYYLQTGLTTTTATTLITSLALSPAFRGYVEDVSEVSNPQENDLAYNTTTQTVWIYTNGEWLNTFRGIDGLNEFINRAQDRYLGLNFEIAFDGIDSYIEFDTATGNMLDFSKPWTMGINIRTFVYVNNTTRAIWNSGTNEIAIEYKNNNYRFVVSTQNGFSEPIGGFNSIADNTRVLIVYDGANRIKFYVDGQLRGDETHTELTTNNNPGTFLEVAKPSFAGHLYYEGDLTELYLSEKEFSTEEIAEHFTTRVINTHSYYSDISSLDYFVFGQDNYPEVNGKRAVSTGEYLNGSPDDYIEV